MSSIRCKFWFIDGWDCKNNKRIFCNFSIFGYVKSSFQIVYSRADSKYCMLLQAITEHNIDISQSYLIGDSLTDILAGKSVGCRSYLIWSGSGCESPLNADADSQPNRVFKNLYQAALSILSSR